MTTEKDMLIPLSTGPLYESGGIFIATLAFPDDQKRREKFVQAYCREAIRLSALEDTEFAQSLYPIRPWYFLISDSVVEKIFAEAERQIFRRKTAFIATRSCLEEVVTDSKISTIKGFGAILSNTSENRYVITNLWLNKKAGASTKPLIRDSITPSRKVIHAVWGLWHFVNILCEGSEARDDSHAFHLIFSNLDLFSLLLETTEQYRCAAIKSGALKLSEGDLVRFVRK